MCSVTSKEERKDLVITSLFDRQYSTPASTWRYLSRYTNDVDPGLVSVCRSEGYRSVDQIKSTQKKRGEGAVTSLGVTILRRPIPTIDESDPGTGVERKIHVRRNLSFN